MGAPAVAAKLSAIAEAQHSGLVHASIEPQDVLALVTTMAGPARERQARHAGLRHRLPGSAPNFR
ncbi:hypothetical protein AB0F17_15760 [Nonomuraea sp. NPDC026600]|uniref:hypothetical protein n=1 Tax=Nonomuraea sp. NPDC026600 TaxID=3155363 RepID=UPI0033F0601D